MTAHHLAVGADDRPGPQHETRIWPSVDAQPEILDDPTAPLFDHRVERGAIAVLVERMDEVEPVATPVLRACRGGGRAAARLPGRRRCWSDVTSQSNTMSPAPVERQRPALGIGDQTCANAPPANACCITVKPISMTISTRPPISAGWTRSSVELPGDGEARSRDPDEQQEPGRDQHDRAVVAVDREIDDQDEADAGHGRDRMRATPAATGGSMTASADEERRGRPARTQPRGCSAHASG